MKQPDAQKHFDVSMIKSAVRIASCISAIIVPGTAILILAVGFGIAEGLGILEELL